MSTDGFLLAASHGLPLRTEGAGLPWPTLRGPFLDRLAALHERSGAWDAVLFREQPRPFAISAPRAEMVG
jgi:hypothetical protein